MEELSVLEYQSLRESKQEHLLLDVRQAHELEICQIAGHVHIPMGDIPSRLAELGAWKNKLIVCQCRSGARSANVQNFLLQNGFKQVKNLTGGILAWGREVDPNITPY